MSAEYHNVKASFAMTENEELHSVFSLLDIAIGPSSPVLENFRHSRSITLVTSKLD